MSALQDPARYHSLDALRGVMVLLGIYLHAAVAYSEYGNWPWKDGSTTGLFDVSLGLIHAFRMPVFYVMAGFFAALVLERQGAVGFARNRAIRILVPFAVGWAVLFPLVKLLAIAARSLEEPTAMPPQFFSVREVLGRLDPMHLWFLEYLLLFYAIALVAIPLSRRLPLLVVGIDRIFRAIMISPLGPCALAVMTFPTLCLMRDAAIDDPSGFAPEGRIVITYLTFFACGWLLWRNADVLSELRRFPRAPILLMVGVVGVAGLLDLVLAALDRNPYADRVAGERLVLGACHVAVHLRLHRDLPSVIRTADPVVPLPFRLFLLALSGPHARPARIPDRRHGERLDPGRQGSGRPWGLGRHAPLELPCPGALDLGRRDPQRPEIPHQPPAGAGALCGRGQGRRRGVVWG